MSDPIKHECGIAFIRLKKPLEYYRDKYGTSLFGLKRLQLLMANNTLNFIEHDFPIQLDNSIQDRLKKKYDFHTKFQVHTYMDL